MDIIQSVIANMTIILAIIGALAFVVSVVTQVIKGVGVFSKVPTDILVFVLSHRYHGRCVCGIHAVHTDNNFMVYDLGGYYCRIYCCVCRNVWMGKAF